MTEPSGPSAGTAPRAPLMRASAGAFLACAALALGLSALPAAAQVAVTTYHNDAMRTGWNSKETQLTWASMAVTTPGSAFGLKYTIPLDQQVDAQPLVVPNVTVSGDPNPGTHDVVYVATQANTLYAIDPTRGTILNSRTLGAAVQYPLGCHNAESVGINSAPVIDTATNSL